MPEESSITIEAWPESPARLEHEFGEEPLPVHVQFDESPAHVRLSADDEPFQMDMAMRLSAEEAVPVCITVCEPLCLESRYQIGITIFDRPVADILIKGVTRVFACDDKRNEPVG